MDVEEKRLEVDRRATALNFAMQIKVDPTLSVDDIIKTAQTFLEFLTPKSDL